MKDLEIIAKKIRRAIVTMNHNAKASHTGSALSIVELLVVLYFKYLKIRPEKPNWDVRDRFILSKGHASSALYATLVYRGFFDEFYLERFYVDDGILPGHIDKDSAPGLDCSAGSLGHGLSIGLGMAIAAQRKGEKWRTVVMISDGELNEGSIWEPILLAPHLKLNNLTLIIDYNKIQSFGATNEVINLEPIVDKFRAFNWNVIEVDGHNMKQINDELESSTILPKVIIAHTIKGKGVSFMENKLEWHYRSPDNNQLRIALDELK